MGAAAGARVQGWIPSPGVALLAGLMTAGCGAADSQPSTPEVGLHAPEARVGDWPTATPEELALDSRRLTALVQRLRRGEFGARHSLLVARGGRLAVEEYFSTASPDQLHTMQSVTKSVTSLLVGIALDQRRIGSVDRTVLSELPRYSDLRGVDPRRDALSLRHLLEMRGGLAWSEDPYAGSDLETLNNSRGDWVRFVLDRPMREAPGTSWQYNSGGVIVLAGVLRDATAMDPADFARTFLFEPLGIQNATWFRSPFDGLPHTGGGLGLRTRDMAKLGELMLRRGRWGGRQIVSEAWLDASTARLSGPIANWPRSVRYGYLWWLYPRAGSEPDLITATGAGGQWIFAARDLDLVVAVTSDQNRPDFLRPLDFMFDEILPSVVGPLPS